MDQEDSCKTLVGGHKMDFDHASQIRSCNYNLYMHCNVLFYMPNLLSASGKKLSYPPDFLTEKCLN